MLDSQNPQEIPTCGFNVSNRLQRLGGFSSGSHSKESTCNGGDLGSVPGLGKSPREGHGNPLPSSGDLPDPGIKPGSPALQADSLPSEPPRKPQGDKLESKLKR